MIDKQKLVGLFLADFAPAALMRQHRIVFFQGDPVGLLEIFLTEPDTNLLGVNGILLHFATPLGRDFLLVGLGIGNAISEPLCSTGGIHCTFFVFAFTLTHGNFPHQFAVQARSVLNRARYGTRPRGAAASREVEGPSARLEGAPPQNHERASASSAGAEDAARVW
jgi:hypothetical protein